MVEDQEESKTEKKTKEGRAEEEKNGDEEYGEDYGLEKHGKGGYIWRGSSCMRKGRKRKKRKS